MHGNRILPTTGGAVISRFWWVRVHWLLALCFISAVTIVSGGCEREPAGPAAVVYEQRSAGLELVASGMPGEVSDIVVEPDRAGVDFGWPAFDGSHCVEDARACDAIRPAQPTLDYGPNSLFLPMPGEVYDGRDVPGLEHQFIWSDFWIGSVRSFRYADGAATEHTEWLLPVRPARWTGFASEPDGSLLVMGGPDLYRILAP